MKKLSLFVALILITVVAASSANAACTKATLTAKDNWGMLLQGLDASGQVTATLVVFGTDGKGTIGNVASTVVGHGYTIDAITGPANVVSVAGSYTVIPGTFGPLAPCQGTLSLSLNGGAPQAFHFQLNNANKTGYLQEDGIAVSGYLAKGANAATAPCSLSSAGMVAQHSTGGSGFAFGGVGQAAFESLTGYDGLGNITGGVTNSQIGPFTVIGNTILGAYTVAADCTGTIAVSLSPSGLGYLGNTFTYNSGKNGFLLFTNPPATVTGLITN